ncbi:DUF6470 family protein [Tepidibacillus fermentans]|uniref:Uncharacterized protein n=1 Tax=Tepidibacillus fermentans TaxID=1281767 RepID=A0A4R3KIK6_9BACI|nr:DUF6470 family protein [Tepidibacillus fermentans]TCS83319.1 hypothetical protein EDD72_10559 [Tepidibacillus fermentans]
MPSIPQIQIRQTYAKIGMDSTPAKLEIRQPQATIEMHQEPAKLEIEHSYPQVEIDQRKAWGALGYVPFPDFPDRIYERLQQVFVNNLAQMAEKGDRFAAIHLQEDPFAEMATDLSVSLPELDYFDTPSYDNVDIDVKPPTLNIQWIKGGVELEVQPNKPEMHYIPGNVDIYLKQRNSLQIFLPKIEQRI